jgi:hypothetical protein
MRFNIFYGFKPTIILFFATICTAYCQEQDTYSLGDTIKHSRIALIVTSVAGRTEVGGTFFKSTPSEGAVYIAVQYKYKNISTKSIGAFSKPPLKLIDPYGNKYDIDVNASSSYGSENKDNEKVISDLNPGITSKASCVFEVSSELLNKSPWELLVNVEDQDYRITSLLKPSVNKTRTEKPNSEKQQIKPIIYVDDKQIISGMSCSEVTNLFGKETERYGGDPEHPGDINVNWELKNLFIYCTFNKNDAAKSMKVALKVSVPLPKRNIVAPINGKNIILKKINWAKLIQLFPEGKIDSFSGEGWVYCSYLIPSELNKNITYKFTISWNGEEKGYKLGSFADTMIIDNVELINHNL